MDNGEDMREGENSGDIVAEEDSGCIFIRSKTLSGRSSKLVTLEPLIFD